MSELLPLGRSEGYGTCGDAQMQTFLTGGPVAFATNQRDEVRDLHDVAGAVSAQPGMKQQTFIAGVVTKGNGDCFISEERHTSLTSGGGQAGQGYPCVLTAGFCAGAGPSAGGIGYSEELSPTLKASESGTNMVPSVLCLNDNGGKIMGCFKDISAAAGMSGNNQPVLFENYKMDARYTGPLDVSPSMEQPTFCIAGNAIDRQPQNGGNGLGCQEDLAYTLTSTDHHAIMFSRQRVDVFKNDDVASTQSARQCRDATDLIYQQAVFGQSQFGNYSEGYATLRAQGGDNGGGSENLVARYSLGTPKLIRRLTPLECERLQGFPDGWTDIPGASDAVRYKALGNSVAIPCVELLMRGIALVLKNSGAYAS